jgi:hypothetical protein
VKVYADEIASPPPPPPPPSPSASERVVSSAGSTGGRDYLRRRLSERRSREATRERAEAFSRHLHAELSRLAESALLHRVQNPELSKADGTNVLNAAYLVHRAESEAFVEHVDKLGEETAGVRVELTGPWAPYSFTNFFSGTEEEAS